MARILSIDYGGKRTGLAVTDPLQIIVTALDTVPTVDLWLYLQAYLQAEEVEAIVFGRPTHNDGTTTELYSQIVGLQRKVGKAYPAIKIEEQDEAFSSSEAMDIMILSGMRKKQRRDKAVVDRISAVIILQRFLGHI
jgi:putative Holliday junction resolvase